MQYDRSLLTVDILGAQPKSRNAYMNRLLPHQLKYVEQIRVYNEYKVMKDNKFQNKITNLGEEDTNMISITSAIYAFLKGKMYFERTNKKHFVIPEGEIKLYRALENYYDQPKYYNKWQIEADRLLCTNDIDGAVPGSLQSQAVRNHDVAQKLRIQREEERAHRKRALYQSQIEQSQEVQEGESPLPYRNKSLSVQLSPVQPTQPYDYMNKPLKLPPISDRITTFTNQANNSKLQLRQNPRTFLSQEQEKTLKFIQKQPALRLFV